MANIPFKANILVLNGQTVTTTGNNLYVNGAQLYPSSNPQNYATSGDLTNASGALSARLGATGASLISLISAASAGVSSINGQSGMLNMTGTGSVSIIMNGQTIVVSGNISGGPVTNNNNFYVNSGTGLFIFQTPLTSGISQQFINFPLTFGNNPTVINSLTNNISNNLLGYQASGITTTGFWLLLSNPTSNTGYILNTSVTNSTSTGLATNVIINNNIGAWSTLTWNNPVIWNVASNVVEDRRILYLSGSTTLNISGLYNGWAGVLKVTQQFSGCTLTLPTGTRVINSGMGGVTLTTGVSGAVDILGFEYDGIDLMVGVGNNFN